MVAELLRVAKDDHRTIGGHLDVLQAQGADHRHQLVHEWADLIAGDTSHKMDPRTAAGYALTNVTKSFGAKTCSFFAVAR